MVKEYLNSYNALSALTDKTHLETLPLEMDIVSQTYIMLGLWSEFNDVNHLATEAPHNNDE